MLAERITLVEGDALDLPARFPVPAFDLVLCHNLLAYVDLSAGDNTIIGLTAVPLFGLRRTAVVKFDHENR